MLPKAKCGRPDGTGQPQLHGNVTDRACQDVELMPSPIAMVFASVAILVIIYSVYNQSKINKRTAAKTIAMGEVVMAKKFPRWMFM